MRMEAGKGNGQHSNRRRHLVAGIAERQNRWSREGGTACDLRIAHAKLAGGIRRQAVFAASIGRNMGGRVRNHTRLRKQEGEYQQEGMQGAFHR